VLVQDLGGYFYMSHDGSDDPIDYTIACVISDLIDGKSSDEVADELGWDIEDVMKIHPDNISDGTLAFIAEENYWQNEDFEDLEAKLQKYRSERK
jgi:hypothetical protein